MNNEKKKTIVLAGLATVMLAVGAFQMIPKPAPAPPTTAASTTGTGTKAAEPAPVGKGTGEVAEKDLDPQKQLLLSMVKDPMPKRDPFSPAVDLNTEPKQDTPPAPVHSSGQTPKATWRPPSGISPMQGDVLPVNPGSPNGEALNAKTTMSAGTPLRQPGEMSFQVKGIIVGKKPMAVIEDDSGAQRLVPLGGSVDGDSKVIGIEKGKVRIRHRGKDKTLNLPEGP